MSGVTLAQAVVDFVGLRLPAQGCSQHTIRSYCTGLAEFLEFSENRLGVTVGAMGPNDITFDHMCAYVEHLKEKGLGNSSINQRISCLKSFMHYLAKRNVAYIQAREAVREMRPQRKVEPAVAWMTLEEVTLMLSLPDPEKGAGLRDLALLTVLYDMAARAQEACDLNVGDVNLATGTAVLKGKGNKTRVVPIGKGAVKILKRHLAAKGPCSADEPLLTNRSGGRLTTSGVGYVVRKYAAMGREASGGCLLAREISPHAFRHSKAMHMLEAGVELIYIRDFLGHASVKTTEVYAKTNPEVKRRTIEAHCAELGLPQKTFTAAEEKSIIEKLRAIGKSSA